MLGMEPELPASYTGTLSTELHPQVTPSIMITKVTFNKAMLVPLEVQRTSGPSTEKLHSTPTITEPGYFGEPPYVCS